MRETPKLLTTTLLALCIVLAGILAGPAFARSSRSTHHHGARHGKGRHARSHRVAKRRQRLVTRVRVKQRPSKQTAAVHPKRTREAAAAKGLDAANSAAATIAGVLATPCQNTELTPSGENLFAVRGAVLCLINRVRAEHNVAPLTANVELEEAAESHNAEMLSVDYFAHVAPDGETPVERIKQTGYIGSSSDGYVIGENLAWGTYQLSTPQSIVEAWIASPEHLANILEARYTETGIGVTPAVPQSIGEGDPGATFAEEFGVIVH